MDDLQFPQDMTYEEGAFLDIVKQRMLQKLGDRRKFIFLYCIEMGHDQREAASVLKVPGTNISRHLRRIREILGEFRSKTSQKQGIL